MMVNVNIFTETALFGKFAPESITAVARIYVVKFKSRTSKTKLLEIISHMS